jgi:hypothetical protein
MNLAWRQGKRVGVSSQLRDTGASVARSVKEALHHPEVEVVLVVAETAGASLRLGQAVELQTNCEVSWHE